MDKDRALQIKRTAKQMPILMPYLDGMTTNLEIGPSMGYLMDALSSHGLTCEGVEPDTRYHQMQPACNHRMYADITDVGDHVYDIITMSHSLEHLNHPLEYLRQLEIHTHPGSRIMADVPNTECNRGSFRLHHPFAYTPFTLINLFRLAGWRLLNMSFCGLDLPYPAYMVGIFERA
jgi:2-polyprenyl-3-methyl-5-hydroxy-6-metoxy-1,4-benzoquinol methylase